MTKCHENESCSKVLNFLERLDDRIGCAQEATVTIIKPREDVGGNKSLGCILSEKSADWTNTCIWARNKRFDRSLDVFLHGLFWVKNESKVPSRIRERDIVTTNRNQVREGNNIDFGDHYHHCLPDLFLKAIQWYWMRIRCTSVRVDPCLWVELRVCFLYCNTNSMFCYCWIFHALYRWSMK